jgi:hypothetical protein
MEASGTIQINEIHGIFEVVIKFIEFIQSCQKYICQRKATEPTEYQKCIKM